MVMSVRSSLRVIASSIGWWGKAESNGAPEGNRVTAGVLRPAGDTSPWIGAVARARTAIGAMPARCSALSHDGVADSLGHDPNTQMGTHCVAGRHGNLAVC